MKPEPKPKRKPGRVSKFNPENCEKILVGIRVGMFLTQAPMLVGVDHDTFRRWIRRGEEEGKGPYKEFADGVKRAEAECLQTQLAVIETAARGGTWQAAAWKAERRFGYLASQRLDLTTDGKPLQMPSPITDELQLAEILKHLRESKVLSRKIPDVRVPAASVGKGGNNGGGGYIGDRLGAR